LAPLFNSNENKKLKKAIKKWAQLNGFLKKAVPIPSIKLVGIKIEFALNIKWAWLVQQPKRINLPYLLLKFECDNL